MWCMCRLTIRGWFTDIPWWRGRGGIHIRGSGLADLTSRLELGLGLDGGEGLDGDGDIGDSIGITIMRGLTAGGITRGAGRFITEGPMLEAVLEAVDSIAPGVARGRSMETGRRLGDTQRRGARAECTRAHSGAMTTADRPGAFLRAGAPALGAGLTAEALEAVMVAEADGGKSKRVSEVCRL